MTSNKVSTSLTVKERIGELLKTDNQDMTDCEFQFADNVNVKSHKIILSIASPVFKAMLYGELKNTSGPQKIEEMESAIFKKMLEFIYTDNVEFNSIEMACEVYIAGEKFLIPKLKDLCEDYISENVNVSDLAYLLEFVKNKTIYDECINFIRLETKLILNDDKFTNLDLNILLTVITQPALAVNSEFELFLAVEKWAKNKAEEKGVSVQEIGATISINKNIRYLSMGGDFAKGPGKSELLSSDEQLSLALNILSPGACAIPQNLCPLRKPRALRIKYQHTFVNISVSSLNSKMYSPYFFVKNFEWRLKLSGVIKECYGHVVLYIEYLGMRTHSPFSSLRSSTPCSATVQLKILPLVNGYQPIKKSFRRKFNINESCSLNPVEIEWSDIFNRTCQFVKDNSIKVEATIEPDPEPEY